MTRNSATTLLALALLPIACTTEPVPEFADWIVSVSDDTPVREYPVVAPGDDDRVHMVEDLVIGNDESNPEALLYRPADIAAAPDGTIFVADRGAHAIKMFASDGSFRMTLGREGQGPGEFADPSNLAIAGNLLIAYDSRNVRFSVWTLDGAHVADHAPLVSHIVTELRGLSDGTLLATYGEIDANRNFRRILVHTTFAGDELHELEARPGRWFQEVGGEDVVGILETMLGWLEEPRFLVAVGNHDTVYFSPGTAYQVLAMSSDGTPRWAMRRAGPPPTIPEEDKRRLVEGFLRREPFAQMAGNASIAIDDVRWPQAIPAIFDLQTDGRGRLFVFLPPRGAQISVPDSWPVHVYSPAGEYIGSGVVPTPWDRARGDHVYELRNALTEAPRVIRYRLTVDGGR